MKTTGINTTKTQNSASDTVISVRALNVYYGNFRALKNVEMDVARNQVLALIGPSGCGKSTLLRCFNRMNDLVPSSRVEGSIVYDGQDLYGSGTDSTEVRSRIGMVFQKPNPFPKSIYDNVAFGLRVNGYQGDIEEERQLCHPAANGASIVHNPHDLLLAATGHQ